MYRDIIMEMNLLRICYGSQRLPYSISLVISFPLSHKNTSTGKRSRFSTILLILDRQVRNILTNLIHQLPRHRRAFSITITPHLLRNSMSLCYRTCMSITVMRFSLLTEFRLQSSNQETMGMGANNLSVGSPLADK